MVTLTTNKILNILAHNEDVDTWDVPTNQNWEAVDSAFGNSIVVNAGAASGTVALTQPQYTSLTVYFNGTPAGPVNYQLPAGIGGFWVMADLTTGGHPITISSATGGGTTLTLVPFTNTAMFCDQINVGRQDVNVALPAGTTGQLQYNAAGVLMGTPGITTDGSNNFSVAGTVNVGGTLNVTGNITTFTKIQAGAYTIRDAAAFSATAMAINCLLSNVFSTVFTANVTVAPTIGSPGDGQTINWRIRQDATGGRTMTWPASFKWPGGSPGVLSTAANATDLLVATFFADTGTWLATLAKGFA